ncbi:MAG: methyltransferase domain-containing protein [Nanoarchaeota archaeon]
MKTLDIGCGNRKKEGAIGLDRVTLPGVDVVCEIRSRVSIPFKNDLFEEVFLTDMVEHVDDVPWLLSEVHRISKDKALVYIRFPHYSGRNAYGDVTHRRYLSLGAFDHFDPQTESGKRYQYYKSFGRNFPFHIEDISPAARKLGFRSLVYNFLDGRKNELRISRIFPIENVNLKMRVIKN